MFDLGWLLLVIVLVVVELVSLASVGNIVTVRRLHQHLKVGYSFKVLQLLQNRQ